MIGIYRSRRRFLLVGLAILGFCLGRSLSAQTLFVAESNNNAALDGGTTPFVSTVLNKPAGVAFDAAGNLYVANFDGNNERFVGSHRAGLRAAAFVL